MFREWLVDFFSFLNLIRQLTSHISTNLSEKGEKITGKICCFFFFSVVHGGLLFSRTVFLSNVKWWSWFWINRPWVIFQIISRCCYQLQTRVLHSSKMSSIYFCPNVSCFRCHIINHHTTKLQVLKKKSFLALCLQLPDKVLSFCFLLTVAPFTQTRQNQG